eukprot:2556633-Rhodomonas_salina.1
MLLRPSASAARLITAIHSLQQVPGYPGTRVEPFRRSLRRPGSLPRVPGPGYGYPGTRGGPNSPVGPTQSGYPGRIIRLQLRYAYEQYPNTQVPGYCK